MSKVNEQSERLIVRSLDGMLTSEEELELNRLLIRDPAARLLRDEYALLDSQASRALREQDTDRPIDLDAVFSAATPQSNRSWRVHRGWLMIPGAIAAAVLAMVIPRPDFPQRMGESTRPGGGAISLTTPSDPWATHENGLMRTVGTVPRVRSNTGREIIGVVGDDGNLYWIEVERTRTIRIPPSSGGARSPRDSM